MIKNNFQKELSISSTQKRRGSNNTKDEVEKIQSWLSLFEYSRPGSATATKIDGDFGPATQQAVKNYQEHLSVTKTGEVTPELFSKMSFPMAMAFDSAGIDGGIRDMVAGIAMNHLVMRPKELKINHQTNSGPWVRSYVDGNDGKDWWWCMGFVQAIIDQAVSKVGGVFTDYFRHTNLCDHVGEDARSRGTLIKNSQWRRTPSKVKKGDIFLTKSSSARKTYGHTGIIVNSTGDIFQTIEGNTDMYGSSNGDGVYMRIRNYRKSDIDVVSLEPLVREFG